jgi:hypothetical protein
VGPGQRIGKPVCRARAALRRRRALAGRGGRTRAAASGAATRSVLTARGDARPVLTEVRLQPVTAASAVSPVLRAGFSLSLGKPLSKTDGVRFPSVTTPESATAGGGSGPRGRSSSRPAGRPLSYADSYLVDPASSHMLVSKIKPCMSKYRL